jgi:hypothetical protein
MTVEAIRVCGEIAAIISQAAVPTQSRLAAQELVDQFLRPALSGEQTAQLEGVEETVEGVLSEVRSLTNAAEDLLDSVKEVQRQLARITGGAAR